MFILDNLFAFPYFFLSFSLLTEIMDFLYFPSFGGLAWFGEPFHRPTLRCTDTQTPQTRAKYDSERWI